MNVTGNKVARPRKNSSIEQESPCVDISSIKYSFNSDHDLVRNDVERRVLKKRCDGICKKHQGIPKLVRIYDITVHKDYGFASMCEEAVDRMFSKGFILFTPDLNDPKIMTLYKR